MSITATAAHVGPLVLPWTLLTAFAAIAIGAWAGVRRGGRSGIDAGPYLYRIVLVGVVAARLGFIWEVRDVYLQHPLDILDLRDGGWVIELGLFAACFYGLHLTRRIASLRKPLIVAGATALAISIAGNAVMLAVPRAEQTFPATALISMNGSNVELPGFTGKPTVVNLWATWCPPCRQEMPVLARAQVDHPGVHFVFVNQGEDRQAVDHYLDAVHLSLRNVLLDSRMQISRGLGYQAMPTTLFFDASGRLVDTRIGALSAATLFQHLRSLHVASTVPSDPSPKATP